MNALIGSVLKSFLRDYIKSESLTLTISGGEVKLRNLLVRPEALDKALEDLPFGLRSGVVGSITLCIPGGLTGIVTGRAFAEPVKLLVEDVHLLVDRVSQTPVEVERKRATAKQTGLDFDSAAYRQQVLDRIITELERSAAAAGAAVAAGSGKGGPTGWAAKLEAVMRNVQIEVTNFHLRFEDSRSQPESPFAFGITFSSFTTSGSAAPPLGSSSGGPPSVGAAGAAAGTLTDEPAAASAVGSPSAPEASLSQQQQQRQALLQHRQARLALLTLYMDPLALHGCFFNLPEGTQRAAAFTAGITTQASAPEHHFLLAPTSPVLQLAYNPSGRVAGSPLLRAQLALSQFRSFLTQRQYHGLLFLQKWMAEDAGVQVLRALRGLHRPTVPVATDPRAWFRFAVHMYTGLVKHKRDPGVPRWDARRVPGSLKRRRAYIEAYKRALQQEEDAMRKAAGKTSSATTGDASAVVDFDKAVDAPTAKTIAELEAGLLYEQILEYRSEARLDYEDGASSSGGSGGSGSGSIARKASSGGVAPSTAAASGGGWWGWFSGGASSSGSASAASAESSSPAAPDVGSSDRDRSSSSSSSNSPAPSSASASAVSSRKAGSGDRAEALRQRFEEAKRGSAANAKVELFAELRSASFALEATHAHPVLTLSFAGSATFTQFKGRAWKARVLMTDARMVDSVTPDSAYPAIVMTLRGSGSRGSVSLLHAAGSLLPAPHRGEGNAGGGSPAPPSSSTARPSLSAALSPPGIADADSTPIELLPKQPPSSSTALSPTSSAAAAPAASLPLLDITAEALPLSNPSVDFSISLVSQPLLIVFAPLSVRAVMAFVNVPASVTVGAAVAAQLSALSAQTGADVYGALAQHTRIALSARIAGPVVVLPEDVRDATSRRLLLHLGNLAFSSTSVPELIQPPVVDHSSTGHQPHRSASGPAAQGGGAQPEPAQEATTTVAVRSVVEEVASYDSWLLGISNVAAYMQHRGSEPTTLAPESTSRAPTGDGKLAAFPASEASDYGVFSHASHAIIEPVSLELLVQTAVLPETQAANRLRVRGRLPRLSVRLSLPFALRLGSLRQQMVTLMEDMEADSIAMQASFTAAAAAAGGENSSAGAADAELSADSLALRALTSPKQPLVFGSPRGKPLSSPVTASGSLSTGKNSPAPAAARALPSPRTPTGAKASGGQQRQSSGVGPASATLRLKSAAGAAAAASESVSVRVGPHSRPKLLSPSPQTPPSLQSSGGAAGLPRETSSPSLLSPPRATSDRRFNSNEQAQVQQQQRGGSPVGKLVADMCFDELRLVMCDVRTSARCMLAVLREHPSPQEGAQPSPQENEEDAPASAAGGGTTDSSSAGTASGRRRVRRSRRSAREFYGGEEEELVVTLQSLRAAVGLSTRHAVAAVSLHGVTITDKYQSAGAAFEQLVRTTGPHSSSSSSTGAHTASSASVDPLNAAAAAAAQPSDSLISVSAIYQKRPNRALGDVPLSLQVNFNVLHVGYNPETIAACQLYALYLQHCALGSLSVAPTGPTVTSGGSSGVAPASAPAPSPKGSGAMLFLPGSSPPPPPPPSSSSSSVPDAPATATSGGGGGTAIPYIDMLAGYVASDSDVSDGLNASDEGSRWVHGDAPTAEGPIVDIDSSPVKSPSSPPSLVPHGAPPIALPAQAPDFRVSLVLGTVSLALHKEREARAIATIGVQGVEAHVAMAGDGMTLDARLSDVYLKDTSTVGSVYPLLVSVSRGAETAAISSIHDDASSVGGHLRDLVTVRYVSYTKVPPSTNSSSSSGSSTTTDIALLPPARAYDSTVAMTLGSLRLVYLHSTISEVSDYLLEGVLGTIVSSAVASAGAALTEGAAKSSASRMLLDVELLRPRLLLPASHFSSTCVMAAFDHLRVSNSFIPAAALPTSTTMTPAAAAAGSALASVVCVPARSVSYVSSSHRLPDSDTLDSITVTLSSLALATVSSDGIEEPITVDRPTVRVSIVRPLVLPSSASALSSASATTAAAAPDSTSAATTAPAAAEFSALDVKVHISRIQLDVSRRQVLDVFAIVDSNFNFATTAPSADGIGGPAPPLAALPLSVVAEEEDAPRRKQARSRKSGHPAASALAAALPSVALAAAGERESNDRRLRNVADGDESDSGSDSDRDDDDEEEDDEDSVLDIDLQVAYAYRGAAGAPPSASAAATAPSTTSTSIAPPAPVFTMRIGASLPNDVALRLFNPAERGIARSRQSSDSPFAVFALRGIAANYEVGASGSTALACSLGAILLEDTSSSSGYGDVHPALRKVIGPRTADAVSTQPLMSPITSTIPTPSSAVRDVDSPASLALTLQQSPGGATEVDVALAALDIVLNVGFIANLIAFAAAPHVHPPAAPDEGAVDSNGTGRRRTVSDTSAISRSSGGAAKPARSLPDTAAAAAAPAASVNASTTVSATLRGVTVMLPCGPAQSSHLSSSPAATQAMVAHTAQRNMLTAAAASAAPLWIVARAEATATYHLSSVAPPSSTAAAASPPVAAAAGAAGVLGERQRVSARMSSLWLAVLPLGASVPAEDGQYTLKPAKLSLSAVFTRTPLPPSSSGGGIAPDSAFSLRREVDVNAAHLNVVVDARFVRAAAGAWKAISASGVLQQQSAPPPPPQRASRTSTSVAPRGSPPPTSRAHRNAITAAAQTTPSSGSAAGRVAIVPPSPPPAPPSAAAALDSTVIVEDTVTLQWEGLVLTVMDDIEADDPAEVTALLPRGELPARGLLVASVESVALSVSGMGGLYSLEGKFHLTCGSWDTPSASWSPVILRPWPFALVLKQHAPAPSSTSAGGSGATATKTAPAATAAVAPAELEVDLCATGPLEVLLLDVTVKRLADGVGRWQRWLATIVEDAVSAPIAPAAARANATATITKSTTVVIAPVTSVATSVATPAVDDAEVQRAEHIVTSSESRTSLFIALRIPIVVVDVNVKGAPLLRIALLTADIAYRSTNIVALGIQQQPLPSVADQQQQLLAPLRVDAGTPLSTSGAPVVATEDTVRVRASALHVFDMLNRSRPGFALLATSTPTLRVLLESSCRLDSKSQQKLLADQHAELEAHGAPKLVDIEQRSVVRCRMNEGGGAFVLPDDEERLLGRVPSTIRVSFDTMHADWNVETVTRTISFVNSLGGGGSAAPLEGAVSSQHPAATRDDALPTASGAAATTDAARRPVISGGLPHLSPPSTLMSSEIHVVVNALSLSLNKEAISRKIGVLRVQHIIAGVLMHGESTAGASNGNMRISGSVADFVLEDTCTPHTRFPTLLGGRTEEHHGSSSSDSSHGLAHELPDHPLELVRFDIALYEPGCDVDAATAVTAAVTSVDIVYLHAQIMEVVDYMMVGVLGSLSGGDDGGAAKSSHDALAASTAPSSQGGVIPAASRAAGVTSLAISVISPRIMLPVSSASPLVHPPSPTSSAAATVPSSRAASLSPDLVSLAFDSSSSSSGGGGGYEHSSGGAGATSELGDYVLISLASLSLNTRIEEQMPVVDKAVDPRLATSTGTVATQGAPSSSSELLLQHGVPARSRGSVMSISLNELRLVCGRGASGSEAGGQPTDAVLSLIRALTVEYATHLDPHVASHHGADVAVLLPPSAPLVLSLTRAQYACIRAVLDFNLGAKPLTLEDDRAGCFAEVAFVDLPRTHEFDPSAEVCEMCAAVFACPVCDRSSASASASSNCSGSVVYAAAASAARPHTHRTKCTPCRLACDVCGQTICAGCSAGKLYDNEAAARLQCCVLCAAKIASLPASIVKPRAGKSAGGGGAAQPFGVRVCLPEVALHLSTDAGLPLACLRLYGAEVSSVSHPHQGVSRTSIDVAAFTLSDESEHAAGWVTRLLAAPNPASLTRAVSSHGGGGRHSRAGSSASGASAELQLTPAGATSVRSSRGGGGRAESTFGIGDDAASAAAPAADGGGAKTTSPSRHLSSLQLHFGFASFAGGVSRIDAVLHGCDINPEIASLARMGDFLGSYPPSPAPTAAPAGVSGDGAFTNAPSVVAAVGVGVHRAVASRLTIDVHIAHPRVLLLHTPSDPGCDMFVASLIGQLRLTSAVADPRGANLVGLDSGSSSGAPGHQHTLSGPTNPIVRAHLQDATTTLKLSVLQLELNRTRFNFDPGEARVGPIACFGYLHGPRLSLLHPIDVQLDDETIVTTTLPLRPARGLAADDVDPLVAVAVKRVPPQRNWRSLVISSPITTQLSFLDALLGQHVLERYAAAAAAEPPQPPQQQRVARASSSSAHGTHGSGAVLSPTSSSTNRGLSTSVDVTPHSGDSTEATRARMASASHAAPAAAAAAVPVSPSCPLPHGWHADDYEVVLPESVQVGLKIEERTFGGSTARGEGDILVAMVIPLVDIAPGQALPRFDSGSGTVPQHATPAGAARVIRNGDVLLSVNNRPLAGMSRAQAVEAVRAVRGPRLLRLRAMTSVLTIETEALSVVIVNNLAGRNDDVMRLSLHQIRVVAHGDLSRCSLMDEPAPASPGMTSPTAGSGKQSQQARNRRASIYAAHVPAQHRPARASLYATASISGLSIDSLHGPRPQPFLEPLSVSAKLLQLDRQDAAMAAAATSFPALNAGSGITSSLSGTMSNVSGDGGGLMAVVAASAFRRPVRIWSIGLEKAELNVAYAYIRSAAEAWKNWEAVTASSSSGSSSSGSSHGRQQSSSLLDDERMDRSLSHVADTARVLYPAAANAAPPSGTTTEQAQSQQQQQQRPSGRSLILCADNAPARAFPWVIRNETGVHIAVSVRGHGAREATVMYSGVCPPPPPGGALMEAAASQVEGVAVPPEAEVGFALAYDRASIGMRTSSSDVTSGRRGSLSAGSGGSGHLGPAAGPPRSLMVWVEGATHPLAGLHIDPARRGTAVVEHAVKLPLAGHPGVPLLLPLYSSLLEVDGRWFVTLRSSVTVHNYTCVDMELFAVVPEGGPRSALTSFGIVAASSARAVPLPLTCAGGIRVRPVGGPVVYGVSPPIPINRVDSMELQCDAQPKATQTSTAAPLPPFFVVARLTHGGAGVGGSSSFLRCALHAPVTLSNLLPVRIRVRLATPGIAAADTGVLFMAPGEVINVHTVSGGGAGGALLASDGSRTSADACKPPVIVMTCEGYRWCTARVMSGGRGGHNAPSESTVEMPSTSAAGAAQSVRLSVRSVAPDAGADDGGGGSGGGDSAWVWVTAPLPPTCLSADITAPHWIVNLTGLPLVYGQRVGDSDVQPAGQQGRTVQMCDECWENERYYGPLLGWKDPLPTDRARWTDDGGKTTLTKEDLERALPPQWEWVGGWECGVWDHEHAFGFFSRGAPGAGGAAHTPQPDKRMLDNVRRRKWYRVRQLQTVGPVDSLSSSDIPGLPPGARLSFGGEGGGGTPRILNRSSGIGGGGPERSVLGLVGTTDPHHIVMFTPEDERLLFVRFGASSWDSVRLGGQGGVQSVTLEGPRLRSMRLVESSGSSGGGGGSGGRADGAAGRDSRGGALLSSSMGYQLVATVTDAPHPFRATRVITLHPRIVLVNATSQPLYYRQAGAGVSPISTAEEGTYPEQELPAYSHAPLWSPDASTVRWGADGPLALHFSPAAARGGWSPPLDIRPNAARLRRDIPVAITVPEGGGIPPYVRTLLGVTPLATIIIGVSVRVNASVPGATLVVVTQQSQRYVPLRPPLDVLTGPPAEREAAALAAATDIDLRSAAEARQALRSPPPPPGGPPAPPPPGEDYVALPYIAIINHSRCVVAFHQKRPRVFAHTGVPLSEGEANEKYVALKALRASGRPFGLADPSLGVLYASAIHYVNPRSVVPVGLVDPDASGDDHIRLTMAITDPRVSLYGGASGSGGARGASQSQSHRGSSAFGEPRIVDLDVIERPMYFVAQSGVGAVAQVVIAGLSKTIVLYDDVVVQHVRQPSLMLGGGASVSSSAASGSIRHSASSGRFEGSGGGASGSPARGGASMSGGAGGGRPRRGTADSWEILDLAEELQAHGSDDAAIEAYEDAQRDVLALADPWNFGRDMDVLIEAAAAATASGSAGASATRAVSIAGGQIVPSPSPFVLPQLRAWDDSGVIEVAGVGLSLIDRRPEEDVYACVTGVLFRITSRPRETLYTLEIGDAEVDDMGDEAEFPVVLAKLRKRRLASGGGAGGNTGGPSAGGDDEGETPDRRPFLLLSVCHVPSKRTPALSSTPHFRSIDFGLSPVRLRLSLEFINKVRRVVGDMEREAARAARKRAGGGGVPRVRPRSKLAAAPRRQSTALDDVTGGGGGGEYYSSSGGDATSSSALLGVPEVDIDIPSVILEAAENAATQVARVKAVLAELTSEATFRLLGGAGGDATATSTSAAATGSVPPPHSSTASSFGLSSGVSRASSLLRPGAASPPPPASPGSGGRPPATTPTAISAASPPAATTSSSSSSSSSSRTVPQPSSPPTGIVVGAAALPSRDTLAVIDAIVTGSRETSAFVERLLVAPLELRLDFRSTGKEDTGAGADPAEMLPAVVVMLLGASGATVTDAPVRLQVPYQQAVLLSPSSYWSTTQMLLGAQLSGQFIGLLGSVDLAGIKNPVTLFKNVTGGVATGLDVAKSGLAAGDPMRAFLGVGSVFTSTMSSIAGTASGVTGFVSDAFGRIAGEAPGGSSTRGSGMAASGRVEKPSSVLSGLQHGVNEVASGFLGGLTGLISKPREGFERGDVMGGILGVGQGIVGIVARPVAGVTGGVTKVLQGLEGSLQSKEVRQAQFLASRPMRLRRAFIGRDALIKPYDEVMARLWERLRGLPAPQPFSGNLVYAVSVSECSGGGITGGPGILIVTAGHVFLLRPDDRVEGCRSLGSIAVSEHAGPNLTVHGRSWGETTFKCSSPGNAERMWRELEEARLRWTAPRRGGE